MIFKEQPGTSVKPSTAAPAPGNTPPPAANSRQEFNLILEEPQRKKDRTYDLFARQIAHELSNERLYLVFAGWCDAHGFPETSKFFYQRSQEEHKHALAFIEFVQQTGMPAPIPNVTDDKCPTLTDMESLLVGALEREMETTEFIGETYTQAHADNKVLAFPILLKYLDEQREEEQWARSILRFWRLCKASGSIVDFENEMAGFADGSSHRIGAMG